MDIVTRLRWKYRALGWRDRFYRWVSNRLPRRFVFFCAVRVCQYATQGRWHYTDKEGITVGELLTRWDSGPCLDAGKLTGYEPDR